MEKLLRLREGSLHAFEGVFGISGLCNIIGAIRLARFLKLGPEDNVVTIATDGFDRYPSVLADLAKRNPFTSEAALRDSFDAILRGGSPTDILDVRPRQQKERLFRSKRETWSKFGYSDSYLESMKSQAFWEAEAAKAGEFDSALLKARKI